MGLLPPMGVHLPHTRTTFLQSLCLQFPCPLLPLRDYCSDSSTAIAFLKVIRGVKGQQAGGQLHYMVVCSSNPIHSGWKPLLRGQIDICDYS